MRFALLQLNSVVGDIAGNRAAVLAAVTRAAAQGAEVCVTPALALFGAPPRDLPLFGAAADLVEQAVLELARDIARIPDAPALVLGTTGRRFAAEGVTLYSQAILLDEGRITARHSVPLAPTTEPADAPPVVDCRGRRLALSLGEDIPVPHGGFDTLVHLAASPFVQGQHPAREHTVAALATRRQAEVLYVNQVGGNDELVFDGRSLRCDATGRLTHRGAAFAEDLVLIAPDTPGHIAVDDPTPEAEIWQALVLGTRDFLRKTGLRDAVLGLSGGIDSALVAAVACEALGANHVTGILMPSPWSSDHSLTDAYALAATLGMTTHTIAIEPGMRAFADMLAPIFAGLPPDVAEENIQARIRGSLLMAFANKHGALLLTTGNKSEIAVGYCTIYGDMCGGLAVIADLPKTEVYRLCRWLNATRGEVVPASVLVKAPSAELRPGQTDQDSLPPYEELDDILRLLLEERLPLAAIEALGHDGPTVRHVARLVAGAEFKRRQSPPGLRVHARGFAFGWHMPIACRAPYA